MNGRVPKLRFTIRAVFLITAIVAVVCACYSWRQRQEERRVRLIGRIIGAGGSVGFSYELPERMQRNANVDVVYLAIRVVDTEAHFFIPLLAGRGEVRQRGDSMERPEPDCLSFGQEYCLDAWRPGEERVQEGARVIEGLTIVWCVHLGGPEELSRVMHCVCRLELEM